MGLIGQTPAGVGHRNEPDDRWQDGYDEGHELGWDDGYEEGKRNEKRAAKDRIEELEKGIAMAIEILEAKR